MSRKELTDLQRECLRLRADGMTTKNICVVMDIGTSTVQDHLTAACQKLGAKNTANAIALAVMRGIITPDDGSD